MNINKEYKFDSIYSTEKHDALHEKLKAYNEKQIQTYQSKDFLLTYEDSNKKLIAGLYAYLKLGMFYIDILWVDDAYRRQGFGKELLKQAEVMALENKALYIRVNTGSFQSPEFYLRNGYEQFAKFPIDVPDSDQHFDCYFIKFMKNTNRHYE